MNKRMDRSRLNIGTYFLAPYARDEKHVRELAECGIDFVVCMQNDRPALDLFAKYGVGAVVTGVLPGWWGGNGDNASKMAETNPLERYAAAADAFADHPAIWGVDTGDEPSALDFPHYGKVIRLVENCFPNQFAYLNLYPNYASVAKNDAVETVNQLGTKTYAEHIERYCENVGTDYICYDFYMYSASIEGAYKNLCTVSDACLRTGRSMWIVLQVNSSRPEEWISENMLRFQAYSAMAFGAENIIWACYTAGWWHNQVLDKSGEKTEQYEKLKTVNAELAALGAAYMKYRRTSTHLLEGPAEVSTGVFSGVRAADGERLLVGQMTDRSGGSSRALMLCAADDPKDEAPKTFEVIFRADGRSVRALSGRGELPLILRADGSYSIALTSCGGAMLIAE